MISLSWLLLFLPLVVAAINHLVLTRKATLCALISTGSALACFLIALMLLNRGVTGPHFAWATVGTFHVNIGLSFDDLATRMMIVVTGIGFLVHLFSLGYMAKDDAKGRYFTGLSLFMFSMTGIVLADNFIMMFIFWELVGLSSYLLIGHWYRKDSAADAAKKAFLTNRIGDFGFMIGILMLWGITGSLTFSEMEVPASYLGSGVLGAAVLCVFAGAMGKSAQVPLHVWLPDAMEGPTPVSALIHAATMVAAGVYMLVRLQVSIGTEAFEGFAAATIAIIGAVTAILAALMATQQNDIKKILAYSTLSQLGYMVMAVGCLAGYAAMFHLFTHAWFKALLFLGAGAIIHACHHEQDIWKMGGLARKMRLTTATFAIGTASLIAIPFTAGFFSKEQILTATLVTPQTEGGVPWFFLVAAGVAALTTFYMLRLFVITFLGKPRGEGAEHAHEVELKMQIPLVVLAVPAVVSGFGFVADSLSPGYRHHPFHFGWEITASILALLAGSAAGWFLYFGKSEDRLATRRLARVFANRFYIDQFYNRVLVRYFQDALAAVVHFLDEILINGLIIGGLSRGAASVGNVFRRIQSGSLQGYSFAFGVGVILVIYFAVFF
jgi:NADH-quinone oxidoreductase subunit L